MLGILTDRGSEYKGKVANHAYELLQSVAGIIHRPSKGYSPQSTGMYEGFNKRMQEEFFARGMRKKLYISESELARDLDEWLWDYKSERPHSGKYC